MTLSLTRRQRKALGKLGAILINLPFVFLIMIPLLYTFMMSVMPADELYSRFRLSVISNARSFSQC